MGLVISKGLTLRKGYIGTDDPDAEAYIAAVEAADLAADPTAEPLETATKVAIHSFVKGAKADGFWPAIKASCILAGARTLNGALVPLVGTAPTNFNFVSGDYNRKTGLVGNGSTKYLNSNRNNNADPQDNQHLGVFASAVGSPGSMFICSSNGLTGHSNILHGANNSFFHRSRSSTGTSTGSIPIVTGFHGISRSASASYVARTGNTSSTIAVVSNGLAASDLDIFRRAAVGEFSTARLAFYSIGESLDLALLDARVTDLINAFGAAIP